MYSHCKNRVVRYKCENEHSVRHLQRFEHTNGENWYVSKPSVYQTGQLTRSTSKIVPILYTWPLHWQVQLEDW